MNLTDSTFKEEVLDVKHQLVLVDFWASWCGPCRSIAPVIEELAREELGRVKVLKLNIDDNPLTARMVGITSLPTIMFFKNGEQIGKLIGAIPKQVIKNNIEQYL